jgi:hypothetical protein
VRMRKVFWLVNVWMSRASWNIFQNFPTAYLAAAWGALFSKVC